MELVCGSDVEESRGHELGELVAHIGYGSQQYDRRIRLNCLLNARPLSADCGCALGQPEHLILLAVTHPGAHGLPVRLGAQFPESYPVLCGPSVRKIACRSEL